MKSDVIAVETKIDGSFLRPKGMPNIQHAQVETNYNLIIILPPSMASALHVALTGLNYASVQSRCVKTSAS
jgi:hypothetical protein